MIAGDADSGKRTTSHRYVLLCRVSPLLREAASLVLELLSSLGPARCLSLVDRVSTRLDLATPGWYLAAGLEAPKFTI